MKFSEMDSNQQQVFRMVIEECNIWIGGNENTMLDYPEESEEYKQAEATLADHDELVNSIVGEIRISQLWKRIDNLHFVSLDWMRERVERRVKKMGY